jgi:acyl-CoA synthetase (NDP forming)
LTEAEDRDRVRAPLTSLRTEGRHALTTADGKLVADAYGTPTPGKVDVMVFAVPANPVPDKLDKRGGKGVESAVLIPSRFPGTGGHELRIQVVARAREENVRVLCPDFFDCLSTWPNLCVRFCSLHEVTGAVAFGAQSGHIDTVVLGFSRTTKTGISAIVGLGSKADLDEDDLLTYFGEEENTPCTAMHLERPARRPQGRPHRRRATAWHRADDYKAYDAILCQAGVIRAARPSDMPEYARARPCRRSHRTTTSSSSQASCVLLSGPASTTACNWWRSYRTSRRRRHTAHPAVRGGRQPIDSTGGESPSTHEETIRLSLKDPRIRAYYWRSSVDALIVFAELTARAAEGSGQGGIHKPVVGPRAYNAHH